ncbi:MAG: SDR family oxidoreductase [Actinobacteria bacterium]|nr:MAG: SDR family oxidoreductase [Actinomycetota bacterium]
MPQPTPSGGRPGYRARSAAPTPNTTWISSGASRLTNTCTGESLALVPGPQSVVESRHWLAGRLALVTGASRGIGAATAEAMAAAGAHVVLAARDREALDGIAGRIRDSGGEATPAQTDISDVDEVERLFAAVEGVGSLAALVCAAGVLRSAPFAQTTPEIWAETLDVNLTGSFLCCRASFAAMRKRGEGRIVNIASLSGVYATEKFPGLTAYNVSKYGVIGLTEGIAAEGKEHGISAICLSPGAVDTQMLRQANPELRSPRPAGRTSPSSRTPSAGVPYASLCE